MNIQKTIKTAIDQFGHETEDLLFLPENRYNEDMFPTTGQYDWFSGEVLYCLIRYLKPRRILEISTASGYATLFMAKALKRNNWGKIDTFELNSKAAHAAIKVFRQSGVDAFVESYIGDARKTSLASPSDYTIYFLDSLHTEDFVRWFIDTHVMRSDRIDALFHMHDILPLYARVRRWNAPPFENDEYDENPALSGFGKSINMMRNLLRVPHREDKKIIPIQTFPPGSQEVLETFDGNCTSEAIFGNKLAALIPPEGHVFLHDIANDYPQLTPRKYDHVAVGRSDSNNDPMEWNESWWCNVSDLKKAYRQLYDLQEEKKNAGYLM
ncbi:MAG: class I SAM-dependent methyltransferase [Pseudomonadota bacterium]